MRYIKIMMGNVLIAGAYACITILKEIVNGGVTSFSMILSKMTRIPTAWPADAFSLLPLAVCFFGLGKEYFQGTIFSCLAYLILFTGFSALQWEVPLPLIPGAVLAAVLVGTGYALCIHAKSTAVGFDTVALMIHRKYPKVKVAFCMYLVNMTVLLSGILVYGWRSVMLGLAFSLLQSLTLHLLLKVQQRIEMRKELSSEI